ncbi:hypothetical protein M758_1G313600 [Ceratodon purpureus]|uniref:Uncharacterized protein n=1 Tax=Ceratodon purpureus TaxID=3225 RepID=A0A8T0JEI9_CERPU|nr:hypothetical protein KC19_1G320300 [Ceratodon purpureus]KAG0632231.1 hypothetical protein M758_1G313600 [Ceratodon purpureus]
MAATMSLTCAHIAAAPSLLSSASTRRRSSVRCALGVPGTGTRSFGRRQWRVKSQSEKAPGSSKTEEGEPTPSWAKPGTEELPPWARNEAVAPVSDSGDLPFPVYLIGSCLVAIAAVGSIFEYFNQNPLFGVVQPDNPLWAPILGVFAITGFPSAGFLFYKAISLANKASEEADRADGYDP